MTPANRLAAGWARGNFAHLATGEIKTDDLARGALLIAEEEEPPNSYGEGRERVAYHLGVLEEIGVRARAALESVSAADHAARVEVLNDFLFRLEGFAGNTDDYYDLRNSLLPRVIERRTGLPITLSAIYIEIARHAGIAVEGIGLPGHFIVRVCDEMDAAPRSRGTLVDPFNCKIIDADDCQERLDEIYGGQVALADEHLRRVAPRQILFRMLQNLKGIYTRASLEREAVAVVERLLLLDPANTNERRDRGMLLARTGRYAEAARDLETYLATVPKDQHTAGVAEALKSVKAQLARLN